MKKERQVLSLLLLFLLGLSLYPFSVVYAQCDYTVDGFTDTPDWHCPLEENFGEVGYYSAAGQTFENSLTQSLEVCCVRFNMCRFDWGSGSPNGTLNAYIYAITGTYGVDAVPTGSPLGTSDDLNMSTLPESGGDPIPAILITFNFSTTVTLSPQTAYAVVVYSTDGNYNAGEIGIPYRWGDGSAHDGTYTWYEDGAWDYDDTTDMYFEVFAETPEEESNVSRWVGIGTPYGFIAISLWSLALLIGVAAALMTGIKDQDMGSLIPVIIIGMGIVIVLFISLALLNAFSVL